MLDKQNICILVRTFPPMKCGIGDYAVHLANILSHDLNITVLTSGKAVSQGAQYQLSPVLNRYLFNPFQLLSAISRIHPDILHIQTPVLSWNSIILSVLQRYWKVKYPEMKIILTLHEYIDLPLYQQYALNTNINNCDGIIVVDPCYSDKILKRNLCSSDKITFIQNSMTLTASINSETMLDIKSDFSANGSYVLMGFFGFINKLKGIEYILLTMKNLKLKNSLKTKFIVLGGTGTGSGNYYISLLKLINDYDLADYVVFTGYLDHKDINSYIAAMDYMNLPFVDGYSPKNSSMIASFSMKKPVITTKRLGRKMIDAKGVYYLDHACDIEKMEEYMLHFQEDHHLFNDVDYDELDYSWQRNGRDHLIVYNSL